MKSVRIIYILFLLFYVTIFAKENSAIKTNTFYKGIQIDSSHLSNRLKFNKGYANSIIKWHKKALVEGVQFSNDDLKNIAISYAYLENAAKASEYLEKYIKHSHKINIINNSVFENISNSKEFKGVLKKYQPEINPWILFFFSTGLIGVFIAIVLNLRKKGDTVANILISLFVLLHSFFMIHLSLFLSKYTFNFPHSLYITASFSFLYGPLLYFYFRRITEKYKFKPIDLLHLLPSIFLFLYFLPIYLLPAEDKLEILFNRYETTYFIIVFVVAVKCISLATYGYLVYKIYRKCLRAIPKQRIEILRWKRNIALLNAVYVISYVIYGLAVINNNFVEVLIYPQILSMSLIVLYVGYTAYVQPRVFSKKYLFNQSALKYQKSGLTESFSMDLKEQLLQLLNREKVYKNNSINLDTLSQKMGTTRHNLSQVINEHFDVNFFNLINKYRILEAQEIFKNDTNNNLHIIDVAYDVGFNNKVTFNKAFKEHTSITPSEYLKSLKRQRISPAY
ncbi:MAG TPA: AraC family transcriptional regulator [Flavobacteriia bacterium]|nr:AraC family transcriptional regulator [Flavobacteriia bacterium]